VTVDDGTNTSSHQQAPFAALFPHLESGGLYFIENLHEQPSGPDETVATRDFLRVNSGGKPSALGFVEHSELEYLVSAIADIRSSTRWTTPVRMQDRMRQP
jgi:hypothetical protein